MALIENDDDYRAFVLVTEKLTQGFASEIILKYFKDQILKYEKIRFSDLMGHKK